MLRPPGLPAVLNAGLRADREVGVAFLDDDPTPRVFATPLLFASYTAGTAAAQVEHDARLVLRSLGGSGGPSARELGCWLSRWETAMRCAEQLASKRPARIVGIDPAASAQALAQMPDRLFADVEEWWQLARDLERLHQEALDFDLTLLEPDEHRQHGSAEVRAEDG